MRLGHWLGTPGRPHARQSLVGSFPAKSMIQDEENNHSTNRPLERDCLVLSAVDGPDVILGTSEGLRAGREERGRETTVHACAHVPRSSSERC
jgi:hypothetical protein